MIDENENYVSLFNIINMPVDIVHDSFLDPQVLDNSLCTSKGNIELPETLTIDSTSQVNNQTLVTKESALKIAENVHHTLNTMSNDEDDNVSIHPYVRIKATRIVTLQL